MNDHAFYIEVAVPLPFHQTFTYQVPHHLIPHILPGKRVWVSFRQRHVTAYIIDISSVNPDYSTIKFIDEILDDVPLCPASLIPFIKWISQYYKYPIGEVFRDALPSGINKKEKTVLHITDKGQATCLNDSIQQHERDILMQFSQASHGINKIDQAKLTSMIQKGYLEKKTLVQNERTKPLHEMMVTLIRSDIPEDRYYQQRSIIIEYLKTKGQVSIKVLKKELPDHIGYISYLLKHGYITIHEQREYRDPFGEPIYPDAAPELTRDQAGIVQKLIENLNSGYHAYLLSGVTGSGKTEIYMTVANMALQQHKHVLVLVPEIALITQTERRFRARFGEQVAVLHSHLTDGQRLDQWMRILENKAPICIGARSAIFAPFEHVGLIIVDEEHDASYKQDSSLSYNARDLAVVRAKLHNASVILGSATPSIQSMYNVQTQKYQELVLKHRVTPHSLPQVHIVDLRTYEHIRGIGKYMTPPLVQAMQKTLAEHEQVLLFLNRRGFSNFLLCSDCGNTLKCRDCDISLTYHKQDTEYRCHLCGFSITKIPNCLHCGSGKIKNFGFGTEQLEHIIQSMFPKYRVARLDQDAVRVKGSLIQRLDEIRQKKIDIIIGTQMITKGHDFSSITLVGIICADLSLHFPDFRSCEKTFQLLAQVSGRAGRGQKPGQVIMQTYSPDHYCIRSAQKQDVNAFYKDEMQARFRFKYPPFSRMILFKISGKDSEKTKSHASYVYQCCNDLKQERMQVYGDIDLMGPIEAPIIKIASNYRWQLILKSGSVSALHEFTDRLIERYPKAWNLKNVKVSIDVDPYFMM
ncbi:MAG: primosomal protein N' [Desulfobacterales bacterium]|nr:primosomal protein N' [Desulfobacterales bacterium]